MRHLTRNRRDQYFQQRSCHPSQRLDQRAAGQIGTRKNERASQRILFPETVGQSCVKFTRIVDFKPHEALFNRLIDQASYFES